MTEGQTVKKKMNRKKRGMSELKVQKVITVKTYVRTVEKDVRTQGQKVRAVGKVKTVEQRVTRIAGQNSRTTGH